MNEDALLQAYARLTLHEFAIEVMMANWLAGMALADADAFLNDFTRKSRSVWTDDASAGSDPATDQIVRDSIAMTEKLASKVRQRAAEIRAAQSRRG